MTYTTWVRIGAVVTVLVLSVGTAMAAEASINAVEPVDSVDRDGDGAVSAIDLRITADTNCVGCNDEADDEPNVNPYFKVFVVGEGGNEVELDATEEVTNSDETVITYALDDTVVQQFDSQTLEVRVELWDRDFAFDDLLDDYSIFVDYERPEDDQETSGTTTDTETVTTTDTTDATTTETQPVSTDTTPTETAGAMDDGATQTASVTADTQTGNGTTVTVSSIVLPEGGFLLVYDTTMAAPLGTSAYLEAGTTEDVTVSFTQVLTTNVTLLVFAVQDTNENQQYDPGTDEVYLAGDQPVVDAATVNRTAENPSRVR